MKSWKHILLGAAVAFASVGGVAVAQDLTVGVSWNNFQEERWKTDEAAIVAALDAGGAAYISTDAQSSAEKQLSDIENMIAQGADALIVLAQDAEAVMPGVQKALDEGIPVIAYDRLIEMASAFYITFDNREVGRMQARAVFAMQPEGNYVFIKGNSADPNADFVHSGQLDILQEAIDAGKIMNVGESYTDNWNPSVAQTNMEQFLTANDNNVDVVVSSNDGMAGGVVAALTAQGLAGSVQVSGQDGDFAALNRVALGTQTVSVWKDARALGKAAGEAAIELAKGAALNEVTGAVIFSNGPKGVDMNSILLAPVPITKDNLDVVIDGNWISKEELCQGVTARMAGACG